VDQVDAEGLPLRIQLFLLAVQLGGALRELRGKLDDSGVLGVGGDADNEDQE
jgi:hypothetical protein